MAARGIACQAVLLVLTFDLAASFSFAVPVRAAPRLQGLRTGPALRPFMTASSIVDEPSKRPITKLRLIQHKAEAFWFYRYVLSPQPCDFSALYQLRCV